MVCERHIMAQNYYKQLLQTYTIVLRSVEFFFSCESYIEVRKALPSMINAYDHYLPASAKLANRTTASSMVISFILSSKMIV